MKTATLAYALVVALALTLACTQVRATEQGPITLKTETQVNIQHAPVLRANPCLYGYTASGHQVIDRTCETHRILRENQETINVVKMVRPDLVCEVSRRLYGSTSLPMGMPNISTSTLAAKVSADCDPQQ